MTLNAQASAAPLMAMGTVAPTVTLFSLML